MTFDFPSAEDALQIHAQQLSRFGGAEGKIEKAEIAKHLEALPTLSK